MSQTLPTSPKDPIFLTVPELADKVQTTYSGAIRLLETDSVPGLKLAHTWRVPCWRLRREVFGAPEPLLDPFEQLPVVLDLPAAADFLRLSVAATKRQIAPGKPLAPAAKIVAGRTLISTAGLKAIFDSVGSEQ